LAYQALPPKTIPNTREFYVKEVLPRNKLGEVSLILHPATLCKVKDLPWVRASKAKEGDYILAEIKRSEVSHSISPFTYQASLLFRGVNNTCRIIASTLVRKNDSRFTLREKLQQSLNTNIKDQNVRALLGGMIFGDISNLSRQIETLFKNTGLFHLLIVSGYQVMLLFFLIRWGVFKILPKNSYHSGYGEQISGALSLIICFNYALLCGMEPPIKRALIFLVILALCQILTIPLSRIKLLVVTAILVVVVDPGSQFTPSFHLTFGALIGFLLTRSPGVGVIFASMFTSLISLIWFDQLPAISVVANLVFAPLFTALSLFGGGIAIFSLLSGGAEPLFFMTEKAILLVLYTLKLMPVSELKILALPYLVILAHAGVREFKKAALENYLKKIFRKRLKLSNFKSSLLSR